MTPIRSKSIELSLGLSKKGWRPGIKRTPSTKTVAKRIVAKQERGK